MEVVDLAKEANLDIYGLAKPKMRGRVHTWAIAPFVLSGIILANSAHTSTTRAAVVVYTVAITSMFAASAAYHRLAVSEKKRIWLRRVDHAMIGVAVAGTYTPIVALVTSGTTRISLLAVLWIGAAGGLVLVLAKPGAPRWIRTGLYIILGWAGAFIIPDILRETGVVVILFVGMGGALYSAGALVYARRSPNPFPNVFGFHELFHSFVVGSPGTELEFAL